MMGELDAATIQALVKEWADALPQWWALVNDGTHGLLGILVGGMISVWAIALLFAFSRGE